MIDDAAIDGVAASTAPRLPPTPRSSRAAARRLALTGGIALSLALAGLAAAWARPADAGPTHVDIPIRYSHYERAR